MVESVRANRSLNTDAHQAALRALVVAGYLGTLGCIGMTELNRPGIPGDSKL